LNTPIKNKVVVVTVTYAKRWHLLRQVLAAVFAQGVQSAVVVDNGSQDDIAKNAVEEFDNKVQVVSLSTNTGSANGYKLGIETAILAAAEYIWLLDDDNKPKPGALEALTTACQLLEEKYSTDCLALLSFRPDHQADIAAGVPLRYRFPRQDSFFGFHLADIPYKIWRRAPYGKPKPPEKLPELIPMNYAPYSGFFFHCSVINRIGLPDPSYVLYGDDNDFTARLTRSGGAIFLVTSSRIDDLESSWNIKERFGNSFKGWLCGGSDFRAYYAARNQVYFESKYVRRLWMYALNRIVYLALMLIMAVRLNRFARLKLLVRAIYDGNAGRLGINPRYPLP